MWRILAWPVFLQDGSTTTVAPAPSGLDFPSGSDPGPWIDVDKVFAPITDGFWWFVTHRLIWVALAVAVAVGLFGAMSGNKNRLAQSRANFGGIVGTIVLLLIAVFAIRYLLGKT